MLYAVTSVQPHRTVQNGGSDVTVQTGGSDVITVHVVHSELTLPEYWRPEYW